MLDFVNEAEDIYRAFKPYYDKTDIEEVSDPVQLETLKHELDQMQVYHLSEVEAFSCIYYKPHAQQAAGDHAELERLVQPAVDRFKELEEAEDRDAFRDKLSAFVRLYAFLSQIIPYGDRELEMLYSFGRHLLSHLPRDGQGPLDLGDEVTLQYYRLERVQSGAIELADGERQFVHGPADVGTGNAQDDMAPLSEIISVLNDRFGTEFAEADRLFFQQIRETACDDERVVQTALANPLDKFELGVRKLIENLMIERMAENDKIVTRYMEDGEFQASAFPILAREIFNSIRDRAPKPTC